MESLNAKLAPMARGTLKVGGSGNAAGDLDASGSGKIVVGDGTDVNSVAVSGDATLAANGALTIGSGLTVSTNAGTLAYSAASKTLTIAENATIDQDVSQSANVIFGDVQVSSDAKWKDNIKQCKGGLDMINKMRGVSWTWNDKVPQAGKQASGIIAQELAHVMPYAILRQKLD